jgi:hypothetical protein
MVIFLLLGRVSLHISQQIAPLLAFWGKRLVPHLNSGLAGMAGTAKHL